MQSWLIIQSNWVFTVHLNNIRMKTFIWTMYHKQQNPDHMIRTESKPLSSYACEKMLLFVFTHYTPNTSKTVNNVLSCESRKFMKLAEIHTNDNSDDKLRYFKLAGYPNAEIYTSSHQTTGLFSNGQILTLSPLVGTFVVC